MQTTSVKNSISEDVRRYLTFRLGEEEYALEILKVQEIIALTEIRTVPMAPSFVRGVINLRGKIISVLDLRQRFGMPPSEDHARKCIIVVDVAGSGKVNQPISLLVDEVSDVQSIPLSDIDDASGLASTNQANYLDGVAKFSGSIKLLLNLDSIISGAQVETAHADESVQSQESN